MTRVGRRSSVRQSISAVPLAQESQYVIETPITQTQCHAEVIDQIRRFTDQRIFILCDCRQRRLDTFLTDLLRNATDARFGELCCVTAFRAIT